MKKLIVVFFVFNSLSLFSQNVLKINYNTDTIASIQWNKIKNLIDYGINQYMNFEKISKKKGVIILKFIELGKNNFSFSISYMYNSHSMYRFKPFSNFFYYHDRLVLIKDSRVYKEKKIDELFIKKLKYKKFIESIINKNKKWLCYDCSISRDFYYVGVVEYRESILKLKLFPDGTEPKKYIIERW